MPRVAAAVAVLVHHVPNSAVVGPQECREGVLSPVVARHDILGGTARISALEGALPLGVDQALGQRPLAQDVAVVVHAAAVVLDEGLDDIRCQRAVPDRVVLPVDVAVAVEEPLEPVVRAVGVTGAVEAAVLAAQAALEHLEDVFAPRGDLVAVDPLERGALNLGHARLLVRPEAVDLATENLGRVVPPDLADDVLAVERAHRLEDVALERRAGVPDHHRQPLAPHGEKPLRYGHGYVDVALARARRPALYVVAVRAVGEVLALHPRERHRLLVPAD